MVLVFSLISPLCMSSAAAAAASVSPHSKKSTASDCATPPSKKGKTGGGDMYTCKDGSLREVLPPAEAHFFSLFVLCGPRSLRVVELRGGQFLNPPVANV